MPTPATNMVFKTFPPSLLMEAANEQTKPLKTFAEWAKKNPFAKVLCVPAGTYSDNPHNIPLWRRYAGDHRPEEFEPGEMPVTLRGCSETRRRKYSAKWHYTDDVLRRYLRARKIVLGTMDDVQNFFNSCVYTKDRMYWHNFYDARKHMEDDVRVHHNSVIVYGKTLLLTPEQAAMFRSIAAMRDKFINLP